MAKSVTVWIDRPDGGREANVGTFQRNMRGKDGLPLYAPDGGPMVDEDFAARVLKQLDGYNGSNCADILADLMSRNVSEDESGALRQLMTYIMKIGATVIERQRRASNDTLRAKALAEIELENLTVFVKAG